MKNRFKNNNKKIKIIIGSVILLLITMSVLLYILIINKEIIHEVNFILNEPINQIIEVNSDYQELGCKLIVDGIDSSEKILINNSDIDTKVLGNYKVKYYVILDKKEYNYFRNVTVVDTTKPEIKLNGEEEIIILLNEEYKDLGATAIDNYDGDITKKIEIDTSKIDNKEAGEYKVIYKVSDSSNNTTSIERNVVVKKPIAIVKENKSENKVAIKKVNPVTYSNTIVKNNFTNSGIYIEGYKKDNDGTFNIKLNEEYTFAMTSSGNGYYKGTIDLTNVNNGTYNINIVSNSSERLLNKMDYMAKIVRSKIGNKLVTLKYDNDEVSITIEDFYYAYDVLIDPGHGGIDSGATNKYIMEKEMNLKVSQYEKCRFENHGYNVYMTRNSDTYGNGMGSAENKLHRRAYEIGYYGSVSRVVYSNHHNAIGNDYFAGYEILIPGYLTSGELSSEISIANKFNSIYPGLDNHLRFYATDYDSEQKYSKLSGSIYNFKDNYAVNRIPHELFNTKSIIYEGCYLTNKNDFDWYWNQKNWIKVSEAKIETYVNFMGGSYNPDNSSCL